MNNENEKKLNFSDFFYTFKKNIVGEIIAFVLCIVAGAILAFTSRNHYVASAEVSITPDLVSSPNLSETSAVSITQNYMPTLRKLIKSKTVVKLANDSLAASAETADLKCSEGAITVDDDGEKTVYIISLQYKDSSALAAKKKLAAIIDAYKDYVEESTEEEVRVFNSATGSYVSMKVQKSAHTPIKTNVSPLYDDTNMPTVTVGSKKKTILTLSGVLGVAAAFIYALCVYFIADKVTSADRLESVTQIRALAVVPRKRGEKKDDNPDALTEFNMNKAADSIIYDSVCTGNKVYQIQSATSGEGKTTVTANLAISLANSDRKTLIIDCDFSKPNVYRAFNLHRHVGITDYFKGEKTFEEVVKHTAYEGVDVITCGNKINNHTIFFTSDKFKQLLEKARENYDFVLLDCAPTKLVSDYISTSSLADGTIVVTANGRVSARDLSRCVKDINAAGGNVVGAIFNFAEQKRHVRDAYYNYYNDGVAKENDSSL